MKARLRNLQVIDSLFLFMPKKIDIELLKDRVHVLENILLPHQELTQWIEEEISDENDDMIECSHDFLQNLFLKVYKLNH